MKQILRCQILTIAKKLRCDVRLVFDEKIAPEYTNQNDAVKNTSITFYPTVNLQLLKPGSMDENGKMIRAPWNPNDNLGMTKCNFPIFVRELVKIQNDMKISDLYTYQGQRLELNEAIAEKIRKVFMIGNMVIELSAVVVIQQNSVGEDERVEGIKMKFNNEQSSVLLTLNDLEALIFNFQHLEIDSIALLMYLNYFQKPNHPTNFDTSAFQSLKPAVDIKPLAQTFSSPDDNIDDIAK